MPILTFETFILKDFQNLRIKFIKSKISNLQLNKAKILKDKFHQNGW